MLFTIKELAKLPGSVVKLRDGRTVTCGELYEVEGTYAIFDDGQSWVFANLDSIHPVESSDITEVVEWATCPTAGEIAALKVEVEKLRAERDKLQRCLQRAYEDKFIPEIE